MAFGPAEREGLAFAGRPLSGSITSLFGAIDAAHPRPHTGVDLATAAGTPIVAPAAGTVFYRQQDNPIFGNWVILEHADGWHSLYGHMQAPPAVGAGDDVAAGDLLGRVGSTGQSTGPHLHWGLAPAGNPYLRRAGALRDPLDFLYKRTASDPPQAGDRFEFEQLPGGSWEGSDPLMLWEALMAGRVRGHEYVEWRGRTVPSVVILPN